MKSTQKMKDEAEEFYANAFCGVSAKILTNKEADDLNLSMVGVVEIDTGDKRGKIYVARMNKN